MRNTSKAFSVIPAQGNIQNLSPAFFFDFHDHVISGDNPTTLSDQSQRYFKTASARTALDAINAVGTKWQNAAGSFDFDSDSGNSFADADYFHEDGIDILSSAYADVLNIVDVSGTLLLWWKIEFDGVASNQVVFQFGGQNSVTYGLMVRFNASGYHQFQISDGAGVAAYANEDAPGVAYTTGTQYNVALAIDMADRTFQFWLNGEAGSVNALSANQTGENNEGATSDDGRRFVIGKRTNGADDNLEPFDGHLYKLGGINIPAHRVPDSDRLDYIVKRLHAHQGTPGREFNGL